MGPTCLADRTRLFVQYTISLSSLCHCTKLSEDIEFIKCLSEIFCRCVSKIKHILSVIHYTIHYTICGAVCFQFTHSPCDDWENIYILCLTIIIKSEVWTIAHCLGLDHDTMVWAVCLSIFLWGTSGADKTQVGPMLPPWTLLSEKSIAVTLENVSWFKCLTSIWYCIVELAAHKMLW